MAQDLRWLRVEMVGCADLLIALEAHLARHAGRDLVCSPVGV